MPKLIFIDEAGRRHEIEAAAGMTVLEIARQHHLDLEGACEGALACSTCHVVVDPDWFDLLPDASDDEQDMLDLASRLQETSRLGCQIVLTEELDGLVVRLPASPAA